MMMPKKRLLITTLVLFIGSSILNASILSINPKNSELVNNYFTEMKIESLIYLFIGLVSFLCSLIFWLIIKYSFYKGTAISLFILSFILIYNGYHQNAIHQKQKSKIEQLLIKTSQPIQTNELDGINVELECLKQYQWINWAILTVGIMLYFLFHTSPQKFWKGFGFGLIISTCIMLSLNKISKNNLLRYQTFIQSIF